MNPYRFKIISIFAAALAGFLGIIFGYQEEYKAAAQYFGWAMVYMGISELIGIFFAKDR